MFNNADLAYGKVTGQEEEVHVGGSGGGLPPVLCMNVLMFLLSGELNTCDF